ncbi:tesmin isoform X1 [Molossus molossus]|uniref:Testis expressed metallothionein like protein n=1 Tax=Molossus molossus TaxID=27622 RepID=A0A7J8EV05_MOLMO|nr:tesmin isoform X1 [Molossus molossus]KAF6439223.1 testis expressed metallothionein like protein [Molossus molossus]
MEEAPLLGGMPGPEEEMGPDLFGAESRFAPENMALKAPGVAKAEEDEFHVFKDPYLSPAEPKEPLLHAFSPPLHLDCGNKVKAGLLVDEHEEEILGEFPSLPELDPLEDAVLPAAPPQAYNVHFLSSLLTPHRSPAVVPLGAWALEGAAHPGVRVIPVEVEEGDGALTSETLEEAALQNPPPQEPCQFPSSQEARDASGSSERDANPMVRGQLEEGSQVLCADGAGAGDLKALHLVPQYQDQNPSLQSDVPKPLTTLVGRFLPVPAKLNLITQLDRAAVQSRAAGLAFPSGPALLGPPRTPVAGHCDCFASGDFCNNCNCNTCCNSLRHGLERFKAIKACLDRNPEALHPKLGTGSVGDVKPRRSKGCHCRRSGCLKNYCECYEAKIMCSSICKCIDCKNYEESPERKTLMARPNYLEIGGFEGSCPPSGLPKFRRDRWSSCISWEVVEATCACLLAQGEEAEQGHCSEHLAQQMILEEFGRCLSQILHIEFKSKGLKME